MSTTYLTLANNVLQELNFENLLDNLKKKKFHMHDIKMETILTSDTDDLFYVCFQHSYNDLIILSA